MAVLVIALEYNPKGYVIQSAGAINRECSGFKAGLTIDKPGDRHREEFDPADTLRLARTGAVIAYALSFKY